MRSNVYLFIFIIDIDECNLQPSLSPCIPSTTNSCENKVGSFKCNCIKGFTGIHCEHNINDCDPNPCANGATCIDLINNHQCICQKGFQGPQCQYVDENVCNHSDNLESNHNNSNDNYWQVVTNTDSCPTKWCKCSKNRGPYCICAGHEYTEMSSKIASKSMVQSFHSLVLIFEQNISTNQSQILCDALRALLILYQESFQSNQLSTSCKQQDASTLVFYAMDDSDTVLKIGDILMSSRNSFHIKQIIKHKHDQGNDLGHQLFVTFFTTVFLLFLASLAVALYTFVRKYFHQTASQEIVQAYKPTVALRIENNDGANNYSTIQRPISINLLSNSPSHQFKANRISLMPFTASAMVGNYSSKTMAIDGMISTYEHAIKCKEKEASISSNEQIV